VTQSAKDQVAISKGETPQSTVYSGASKFSYLNNLGGLTNEPNTIMAAGYKPKKEDLVKDIETLKKYKEDSIASPIEGENRTQEIQNKIDEFEKQLNSKVQEYVDAITELKSPVLQDETRLNQTIQNRAQLEKDKAARKEYERTTFRGGVESSIRDIDLQTEEFSSKLGRQIPQDFASSMKDALRELSNPNSTEPLKNRLLGVAAACASKIQDAFLTQAANQITSSLFGGSGFGGSKAGGFASGGMISGGSGAKDDVPAMLMAGEYVLNKSAVQKYGASYLQALNNGTIKKFADGGAVGWSEFDVTKYQDPTKTIPYGQKRDAGLSFDQNGLVIGMNSYTGTAENQQDALKKAQTEYYSRNTQTGEGGFYMPGQNGAGSIMGAHRLLAYATQQSAGTKYDKISGYGNMGSVDLGAGSANMTLFGLRDAGNSRNAAYLESKQKALDLFLNEIDSAKEKANKEEEIRKEIERIKEEQEKQKKAMKKGLITQLLGTLAMSAIGAGMSGIGSMLFGSNSTKYQNPNVIAGEGGAYSWNPSIKNYQWMSPEDYNTAFPKGATYKSSPNVNWGGGTNPLKMYSATRMSSGGYVNGNGMGDNVPAMLNGGEFVISKQAAQNIGANKLQQLNSTIGTTDISESLSNKLDELVEKLSAVGTLNITVNSDSNGRTSEQENGGNQDQRSRQLAKTIIEVVLTVLKEEKRLGGMLR
jgi:hypothetical protein